MTNSILSQFQIDRNARLPIYKQIQTQLESLIAAGVWAQDEPLPSETALADTLNISVMTVRQAMTNLVNKGLITREKGRGTFIIPAQLNLRAPRLQGFAEDMRSRALNPASIILAFERVIPPSDVAARLALKAGTPVLFIKRLRSVSGYPIAVQSAYVRYTELTRAELEATGSLYAVLEQHGVHLVEADETLRARLADADTARLLEIAPGAPIMEFVRTTWDDDDNTVEYVEARCRGDLYEYSVRLKR